MKDITTPMPATDSFAGAIVTILSLSGELSIEQTKRLTDSASYQERALKRMRANKLIRTYYKDELRGLRLTAAAKRLLLHTQPDKYAPILAGENVVNAPKYNKRDRTRLHAMSEVLVTMHNAGVLYQPNEKPALFQTPRDVLDLRFDLPTYYTSLEAKSIGAQRRKILGSRAAGVLLTEDAIYAVYNASDTDLQWKHASELDFTIFLQTELRESRLSDQYWGKRERAIAFASDMSRLSIILKHDLCRTRNYFVLDSSFEHFHFLTSDRRGERVLTYLCDSDKRERLNAALSAGLLPRKPNWAIPNDGFDADETPVLFGYTCDVPRIFSFKNALEMFGQTGILYCFGFQAEAIRSVCGERVQVRHIVI